MSTGWVPFTTTWTHKRKWYERFMFWRPKPKSLAAVYKQVGRTVHIRTNPVKPSRKGH